MNYTPEQLRLLADNAMLRGALGVDELIKQLRAHAALLEENAKLREQIELEVLHREGLEKMKDSP